jgi:hypothetical protein
MRGRSGSTERSPTRSAIPTHSSSGSETRCPRRRSNRRGQSSAGERIHPVSQSHRSTTPTTSIPRMLRNWTHRSLAGTCSAVATRCACRRHRSCSSGTSVGGDAGRRDQQGMTGVRAGHAEPGAGGRVPPGRRRDGKIMTIGGRCTSTSSTASRAAASSGGVTGDFAVLDEVSCPAGEVRGHGRAGGADESHGGRC